MNGLTATRTAPDHDWQMDLERRAQQAQHKELVRLAPREPMSRGQLIGMAVVAWMIGALCAMALAAALRIGS